MRVSCPDCEVSLLVPGALASGGGFDDLFDEPGADSSGVVAGPGTVSTTQPDLDTEEQPLQLEEDPVIAFAESSQVPVPEQGGGNEEIAADFGLPLARDVGQSAEAETAVESGESDEFELKLAPLDETMPADTGKDPFEVDPDAPLKIEGLEAVGDVDQVFGLKCDVCDTRIHVNLDQVDSTVQCPVCFSNVAVTPPVKQPKSPSVQPESKTDAGDELALQDAGKLPPAEQEIEPGYGLEPVDKDLLKPIARDEDQIVDLEILDEGDEGKPPEASYGIGSLPSHALADEDEMRLEDLPDESQAKSSSDRSAGLGNLQSGGQEDSPAPSAENAASSTAVGARWREEPGRKVGSPSPQVSLEDGTGQSRVSDTSLVSELRQLVDWLSKVSKNPQLIIATLVSLVLFTIGYSFFELFYGSLGDKEAGVEANIVGMIGYGFLGCLFWLPGVVFFSITFSVLLRDSAEGDAEMDQWPDLAFSEWFVAFAFTAVSFWAASLPGLFFGSVLMFSAQTIIGFLIFVPFFVFLVIPVCLVSALYNESVVNIFSIDIIKSFADRSAKWWQLYQVVLLLLLFFLVGTMVLYLPTIVFSFLGAVIQVVTALGLAAAVGLHAGRLFNQMK